MTPITRRSLLAALAAIAISCASPSDAQEPHRERVVVQTASGDEHVFHVEIADEQSEILRGLTLRTDLPIDEGMLFVFPDAAERSFWMRNTYIELDILFLRSDGRIVRIHHRAVPGDLSGIPSGGPVSRVLEIGGGRAEALGIREGDLVRNPTFFLDPPTTGGMDSSRPRSYSCLHRQIADTLASRSSRAGWPFWPAQPTLRFPRSSHCMSSRGFRGGRRGVQRQGRELRIPRRARSAAPGHAEAGGGADDPGGQGRVGPVAHRRARVRALRGGLAFGRKR